MSASNGELKIGGALTFSALAEWSVRLKLEAGLQRLGYMQHVPEPRSATACLKDALHEVFTERSVEIKPLAAADSFEVIRIQKGEYRNSYDHLFGVSVDDERRISLRPYVADTADRIMAEFNQQLGLLRAYSVTQCLTGILRSLGGTSLRPKGALYWVPPPHVGAWAEVAGVVDGCGFKKPNAVYLLRHQMDADAVRAVRDGIVNEVRVRSQEISREVLDPDNPLKARGLARRQEEAQELHEKVKLYEELLGVGLSGLTQTLEEVEATIGQAALLTASAAE